MGGVSSLQPGMWGEESLVYSQVCGGRSHKFTARYVGGGVTSLQPGMWGEESLVYSQVCGGRSH